MKKRKTQRPERRPTSPRLPEPPGSASPGDQLRVEIDGKTLAQVLAHGAESPNAEICGVLVGRQGRDGKAPWIEVSASIRGEGAREEGAHVTFTHDTWNHINREIDDKHAELQIVGWYHTHPGFGVFLSDMDSFIHKNFFQESFHVALVYDPLAGQTALFTLQNDDLVPLSRFWRDGRPVELTPPNTASQETSGVTRTDPEMRHLRESLKRLEMELAAGRRSLVEEWVTPILLILLIAMLSFQLLFPPRTGDGTAVAIPLTREDYRDPRVREAVQLLLLTLDVRDKERSQPSMRPPAGGPSRLPRSVPPPESAEPAAPGTTRSDEEASPPSGNASAGEKDDG